MVMTQQWTKSVALAEVEVVDDGDILQPLRKLQAEYLHRMERILDSAHGDDAADKLKTAKTYRTAAEAVGRLLEQK
jgi:hypothetical protein